MKKIMISTLLISLVVLFCLPIIVTAGELSSLNITMTGYELENTQQDVTVTVDNSNVQVVDYIFTYGNSSTPMEEKEKFDGGVGYCIQVYLKSNSNADISKLKASNVKVNGKASNYYYLSTDTAYRDCYKVVAYLQEFKTDDYAVIVEGGTAKINGKTITRAKPGDKVSVSLDGEETLGSKYFIKWWCSDYTLGTEEKSFSFEMPNRRVSFIAYYGVLIQKLDIIEVIPPVGGEKPVTVAQATANDDVFFTDNKSKKGIQYVYAEWSEIAKDGDSSVVKDTFKYNTKYLLKLQIAADTPNKFLMDKNIKDITVNGKKISADKIDASELAVTVYCEYETGDNPNPQVEEPKVEEATPPGDQVIYSVAVREKDSDKSVGGKVSLKTDSGTKDFQSAGYSMPATKDTVVVIKAQEDNGYKFVGWYELKNGKENRLSTKKEHSVTAEAESTFIAIFERVLTHKVTFDTNGGSSVAAQNVEDKGKATKPTEPTKDGFNFDGWYIDKELSKAYNFLAEVTADITLYSKWTEVKIEEVKPTEASKPTEVVKVEPTKQIIPVETIYEISFNTNGGSKIEDVEVKSGDKLQKPKDPTKKGYTFDGWYTDKKLIKAFDFETNINDDYYLHAKWVEAKTTPTPGTSILWTNASEWALDELTKADTLGIIPEIFNKQDLTQNITRKEFAHVAVKLYEKLTGNKAVAIANNPFKDTNDAEVLKAYNVEITKGVSEDEFAPDTLITREQMATMMTRALTKAGINTAVDLEKVTKFSDDAEMNDWGKPSIYYMSSIEIIKGMGDGSFGVSRNASREQALLISERSVEKFTK